MNLNYKAAEPNKLVRRGRSRPTRSKLRKLLGSSIPPLSLWCFVQSEGGRASDQPDLNPFPQVFWCDLWLLRPYGGDIWCYSCSLGLSTASGVFNLILVLVEGCQGCQGTIWTSPCFYKFIVTVTCPCQSCAASQKCCAASCCEVHLEGGVIEAFAVLCSQVSPSAVDKSKEFCDCPSADKSKSSVETSLSSCCAFQDLEGLH